MSEPTPFAPLAPKPVAPEPVADTSDASDGGGESPLSMLGVEDAGEQHVPKVSNIKNETKEEKRERKKLERTQQADFETEVMIDGRTFSVPVKELADAYQIRQMSQRKASEADRKIKELEAKINRWKQAPDEFFDDPKTRDEWAQTRVARMIEELEMTPEQRELQELRALKQREEERKTNEDRERMKSEAMSRQQSITKYVAEGVTNALQNSWLPADSDTLEEALKIAYQASISSTKLTFPQIVQILEEKAINRQKKFLTSTKVDKLAELVPDHFEQVRKYQVERMRQTQATQTPNERSSDTPTTTKTQSNNKYMNEAEYKKYLAKLKSQLRD